MIRNLGDQFHPALYRQFERRAKNQIVSIYIPYRNAVRMALSLFELKGCARSVVEDLKALVARYAMMV